MNKFLAGLGAIAAIGAIIMLFLVIPIAAVAIGWIAGFMVSLVFGDMVAEGFNALFNTARFAKGDIPTITATLALIGSFFQARQTIKSGGD